VARVNCSRLVLVLALVVAGCGDSQDDRPGSPSTTFVPRSTLVRAAAATERAPGAAVSTEAKLTVLGLRKPIGVHLQGVEDLRRRSGRVAGVYTDFPAQAPGADPDGTTPMEVVSVPPDLYVKSPLVGRALPRGKSWLHLDAAQVGKQLGLESPGQFGRTDPAETFRNLRATTGRVAEVGRERVGGVETTHYRATVELRKLAEFARPSEKATVRAHATRMVHFLGTGSYPIDVWIDSRHLVRRTRLVMKLHEGLKLVTLDMTADMYDFGPKPRPRRPPAAETYDAAKLPGGSAP
jgi:hypothetical protein